MKIERLGDHATFLSGFAFKSNLFNDQRNGMPIIRIRDVVRGRSETYYSGDFDKRYLVGKGDYLIGMDGEFNLARWDSEPALLNQRVCKIDSLSGDIDRDYLARFLPSALKRIEDATPFVTVKHLSVKALNEIEIPLPHKNGKPDLDEQKRIAAILDKADAIRRKIQQSLRLSDDFLRSVFLDMFGDPVTNPKGWPLRTLTSVIGDTFRNGLSPSTSGIVAGKVLTLSAVTSGTFASQFLKDAIFDRTPSTNQQVTRNTFLICRGNGNKSMVGIGVFPEADMPSVSFPDTMIACTVDRTQIEPEYLQGVWSTAKVRKQIDAGARTTNGTYKVNQALLGGIEFPLPSLATQKKFSNIIQATRSQSAKVAELAAESETLFSSLQQRAFRGEL